MLKRLLIDTGTWIKIERLLQDNIISIQFMDNLYDVFEITITPEIEFELNRYKIHIWQKSRTYVVPVQDLETKNRVLADGFDEADASTFGFNNEDLIVLSEDRPLIKYGRVFNNKFLFFADFLLLLYENGLISKRNLYNLNKHLFSIRNINKKLFKDIKIWTHEQ